MKKHFAITVPLTLSFFIFDQFTKWIAANSFRNPLEIFSFFRFIYRENTGIAWSLPVPSAFLVPLVLAIIVLIIHFAYKNLDFRRNMSSVTLSLVLGGAVGNLYDRITLGYVIDFISVGSWPVFNLADTFLVVGIFLLVAFYGKIKKVSK